MCEDGSTALNIGMMNFVSLDQGMIQYQTIFNHALHRQKRTERDFQLLKKEYGEISSRYKTQFDSLQNLNLKLEGQLQKEKFLMDQHQRQVELDKHNMQKKNETRDMLMIEMKEKVKSLTERNRQQEDKILRFPREHEAVKHKWDQDLKIKMVEMHHKDSERRTLLVEMKKLLYWKNKAQRIEAEFTEYKMKQSSLKQQAAKGIVAAITTTTVTTTTTAQNLMNEDSLVQRLREQLLERDHKIAKMRGQMAQIAATPLLNMSDRALIDSDNDCDEEDDYESDEEKAIKSKFRKGLLGNFDADEPFAAIADDDYYVGYDGDGGGGSCSPLYISDDDDEKQVTLSKRVEHLRHVVEQSKEINTTSRNNHITFSDLLQILITPSYQ